jgi:hypothetical protein
MDAPLSGLHVYWPQSLISGGAVRRAEETCRLVYSGRYASIIYNNVFERENNKTLIL